MGTTGPSEGRRLNAELPAILLRIHSFTHLPLAVGFGVTTRSHFNYAVRAGADGVVLGSKLVQIIDESPRGEIADRVERCCQQISGRGEPLRPRSLLPATSQATSQNQTIGSIKTPGLPSRFGEYGGQYVPEPLVDCLVKLEAMHKSALADPEFWKEFRSHFDYINRPSDLYLAKNLTEDVGGANIWLKREDLYGCL